MTASDSTAPSTSTISSSVRGLLPAVWMTTDTLGLGDGAPRIRQIREQRWLNSPTQAQ